MLAFGPKPGIMAPSNLPTFDSTTKDEKLRPAFLRRTMEGV